LAVEIVKAFVRDVGRGIFLRVVYLVEFPTQLVDPVEKMVKPRLLSLHLGVLVIFEVEEMTFGPVALRDKHGLLAREQITSVCNFASHRSLLRFQTWRVERA